MELLAEGGYMVGKMAQLLYPEGIEIKTDKGTLAAIEQTQELLNDFKISKCSNRAETEFAVLKCIEKVTIGTETYLRFQLSSKSHSAFHIVKCSFEGDHRSEFGCMCRLAVLVDEFWAR
jgi:hypothetical protein